MVMGENMMGNNDMVGVNKDKYYFFCGGRCSQWFKSTFMVDGIEYNCVEQFMMAQKALFFDDYEKFKAIMNTKDPKAQKNFGRLVNNYDDAIWSEVRYSIVLRGNMAKFTQNDELKRYLKSLAGKVIVEASPYDTIWGIGLGMDDPRRFDESKWRGTNLLGKALMEVRDKLLEEDY